MVRGWRVWACRVLKAWLTLKHSVKLSKALIWAPFCLVAALTGANRMRRSNVLKFAAVLRPGNTRGFLGSSLLSPERRLFPLENWIGTKLEWSDKWRPDGTKRGRMRGRVPGLRFSCLPRELTAAAAESGNVKRRGLQWCSNRSGWCSGCGGCDWATGAKLVQGGHRRG